MKTKCLCKLIFMGESRSHLERNVCALLDIINVHGRDDRNVWWIRRIFLLQNHEDRNAYFDANRVIIIVFFHLKQVPILLLIGLWARSWPKLDVLLLDNYLTLCMFTKSSIEGIDMFTFCRIYVSNCLPIEVKKYDMYCRKKWEKWYIL